jgi:CHAT domain-containing protein
LCLKDVLKFAQSQEDSELVAAALRRIGSLYREHGELEDALDSLRKAAQVSKELGLPEGQYWTLGSDIAGVYRQQGRLREALQVLDDLLASPALPAGSAPAFLLTDKGVVLAEMGDYFRAIQCEKESIRIFEGLKMSWQAGAGRGMLGMHYASLGDYQTARGYFEGSLASARRVNDPAEVWRNLYSLGDLYLRMDRPGDALEVLKQGNALQDESLPLFVTKTSLNLGRAYLRLGKPSEALAHLEEAIHRARSEEHKRYEAESLAALGDVHLYLRHFNEAARFYQDALNIAEPSGLADMIVAAREGLGGAATRQGGHQEAVHQFEQAIATLESVRSRVPDPGSRTGLVQQHAALYEQIVASLYALHVRSPTAGYDRKAFDFAERGRARSFLESLSEARAHVSKGLSAEQSRQQTNLELATSKASKARLASDTPANREALKKGEDDLNEWIRNLRATNRSYMDLHYPEPYTAAKVQKEISRPGLAILVYSLGESRSFLWLIEAGRLRIASLPSRAAIEARVKTYRRAIAHAPKTERDFQADQATARELHGMLLGPVENLLARNAQLLVIPDGILYYLPFETLLAATGRYLVEDHAIVYAPSVSVYGSLLGGVAETTGPHKALLAFGDPPFGKLQVRSSQQEVVRSVYERSGLHLRPLPNTRREVQAIGALYPERSRKLYLGSDATEAAVKRERLLDYRRIHFATHAIIDELIPARSGVVLSLVNTGEEDGVLRMPEIFNLEMNADLVVLSACQTGLGKLVHGEGMVGLTRAFLYAGSRRVAVSLWEVNDLATADFMKSFYEHMATASPAAALRAAKLAMIHSPSPAYRHPYFWAPFVLTGMP